MGSRRGGWCLIWWGMMRLGVCLSMFFLFSDCVCDMRVLMSVYLDGGWCILFLIIMVWILRVFLFRGRVVRGRRLFLWGWRSSSRGRWLWRSSICLFCYCCCGRCFKLGVGKLGKIVIVLESFSYIVWWVSVYIFLECFGLFWVIWFGVDRYIVWKRLSL